MISESNEGANGMPGRDPKVRRSKFLVPLFIAAVVMLGAGIGTAVMQLSGHESLPIATVFLGLTVLAAAAMVLVAYLARRAAKKKVND